MRRFLLTTTTAAALTSGALLTVPGVAAADPAPPGGVLFFLSGFAADPAPSGGALFIIPGDSDPAAPVDLADPDPAAPADLADPDPADPADRDYQCKGAEEGVYRICLYNQSGIEISGRTFENYQNGIFIKNSKNITISGNTFKDLRGPKGWAGVHVKDSTDITITGNTFTRLTNAGKMHGVYLVRTSDSRIKNNKFLNVSGDPVRVRDAANNNIVERNTFINSGRYALFSEWAMLRPYGTEECSTGNVLKNNEYNFNTPKQVKVLSGGKSGGTRGLEWGSCSPAGVKDGGGNRKI